MSIEANCSEDNDICPLALHDKSINCDLGDPSGPTIPLPDTFVFHGPKDTSL